MKKLMRNFMVMALGLSLVLAGCSKDEDSFIDVAGTYSVRIDVSLLPLDQPIETDLLLTKEGNNLKAVANIAPYGIINITLSDLNSDLSSIAGFAPEGVSGYLFKIAQQKITITGIGEVDVIGSSEMAAESNGYHGVVYKKQEAKFIVLDLQGVGEGLENLKIYVSARGIWDI
jgi:hypothetical protein